MNELTYAIYRNVPPVGRASFARARRQGIVETFDNLRNSLDGEKIIFKWRGEQPAELAPGLILWMGSHAEVLRKLVDDSAEWTPPEVP